MLSRHCILCDRQWKSNSSGRGSQGDIPRRYSGTHHPSVVTKAVHEMILGIDFLIDADVDWSFHKGKIKIGKEWVKLRKRETSEDVRKVYVCADCVVPPGAHTEVPIGISQGCAEPDFWAKDPIEILEGAFVIVVL